MSAGRWKNVFDAHHLWQGQGVNDLRVDLCPWYVLTRGQSMRGVPWNAPAYQLTHDAEVMLTPPTLELSASGSIFEVNFVTNGNYEEFALAGWATPDQSGTWSESPWAAMAFRPQVVQGSGVEILLRGEPFRAPGLRCNPAAGEVVLQGDARRSRTTAFNGGGGALHYPRDKLERRGHEAGPANFPGLRVS